MAHSVAEARTTTVLPGNRPPGPSPEPPVTSPPGPSPEVAQLAAQLAACEQEVKLLQVQAQAVVSVLGARQDALVMAKRPLAALG